MISVPAMNMPCSTEPMSPRFGDRQLSANIAKITPNAPPIASPATAREAVKTPKSVMNPPTTAAIEYSAVNAT